MVLGVYPSPWRLPPPNLENTPLVSTPAWKIYSEENTPLMETKAFQFWEFYLSFVFLFSIGEKNFSTCILYVIHSILRCVKLKNKLASSLVSFSLAWPKTNSSERIYGKFNFGYIFAHREHNSVCIENNS